ncbi:peptidoglycan DD-metalloendopeptidase family protein [Streptomyces sp. NPDC001595]|uniref:peptidoglycan DD-metalloendopeptidase family protein n=1 Tax=Streptomyces sp. NPDC001532 TaxID=3154520 RepID=UPI00331BAB8B
MAADLDIVGTAAVDVVPIAPRFHSKLEAIVLPAADRVGRQAGEIIGDQIGRQIATAIPSAINNGGNAARNAATRAGNNNGGAFARAFENRLRAAFQSLPRPDVRLSTTGFDADLARLRARMETLSNKTIGVDIDAATAIAEMEAIDAKLAELGSRSPNVQIRADVATARAELAALQRQINDIDRDDVNIKVRANTTQAHAALLQLTVAMGAVAALPVIPVAAAAIGAIASAAFVAAAGVGALALAAVPAIKGVTGVIQAKSAAEKEAASATDKSAAANVRAAQNALQMASAQQALTSAHRNAARSIAQANRQVEDAERALAQAAVRAMEQREQAAERVEDAEQSLADAKRASRQAEEDLTQARRDAAQQLEDLNSRLASGALDEREAALRVQEAYEDLQATLADPTASDLQRDRAQLAYDQAVQNQKDQATEYRRLQQTAAEQHKAGVEGNEDVRRATQSVADAQQNVRDQAEALTDAQRDAAQTQVDAAQSVADAQRNLADAVDNAAVAQVQAAESIEAAERGVESARLSSIDTTANAKTKADEFREALAKLTPEQRDLYDSIAGPDGLSAAFKEWSASLQPDVLPIFTRFVDGAKNALPGLTPLVEESADAVNELMDRASEDMKGDPFWDRFKTGIVESAQPAIVGMGTAFGNVFKGMAGILDAFFPHMDSISQRMQDITGRFAERGTGLQGSPEFESFLQYASDVGPLVAETIGDIFSAVFDVAKSLEPASRFLLTIFGYVADSISWISENAPWAVNAIYALFIVSRLWAMAMAMNPIGAVILGLIALALAVKYAWDHFEWFRDIVTAVWEGIQGAAEWAWTKVLQPVFLGIWEAIKWVGDAFVWLWQEVVVPVWNAISLIVRTAVAVIVTVLLTPLWLAIQAAGLLVMWLWEDCFKPTWDLIAALATWLWDYVLSPFFTAIWEGIKWVGDQFVWLYDHAVKPSADWIVEKLTWLWNEALTPLFGFIWDGVKWVGDKFVWLYDHAVKPAFDFITEAADWLWDKGLKPAFDTIKEAVGLVGDAFDDAKKAIKAAWNEVAGIAAAPVNFIVEWVYTRGIKAVWDRVAEFVGLGKLPDAPKLLDEDPKFASGGRVFGGIPGKDSVRAWLMPGEYVVKTDSARKIGYANLEHLNRTGEVPGVPKFADGGVVGALGSAWDWTTGKVGSAVDTGIDWAKTAADFLTNPSKIWDSLMKPILGDVAEHLGVAQMGKVLAKYPLKMAGDLKDKIVSFVLGGGGGDGTGPLGNGQWAKPVNAPFGTRFGVAGSMWSSGHHTGLDFPAATGTPIRAVDRGRVVTAASGGPYGRHVLIDHGGGLASLYAHMSRMATAVGQAVTRGQTIGAVGATGNVTGPHLHLEARRNGRTIDPMPFLYDDGGYLQPGMNLVANGTGKPEPVLTSAQWAEIRAAKSGGGPVTVNVESKTYLDGREVGGFVDQRIEVYDAESARSLDNGRWV